MVQIPLDLPKLKKQAVDTAKQRAIAEAQRRSQEPLTSAISIAIEGIAIGSFCLLAIGVVSIVNTNPAALAKQLLTGAIQNQVENIPGVGQLVSNTTQSSATGSIGQQEIAAKIIATMERKGYAIAKGEGEINIVHVEGMNKNGEVAPDSADIYDDLRIVIQYRNGQPTVPFVGMATTEASGYWTGGGQMNPKGAARLQFGQYQAWQVGQHCGSSGSCHEALVQVAPVTVMRDANADKSRAGDQPDTGLFGINIHGGQGGDGGTVGAYSAGCLVSSTMEEHRQFMSIVKSSSNNGTFYGTLLDGSEVLNDG